MFVSFGGQPAAVNSGDHDGYWKHGAQTSSQIHQTNPIQPNYQSHLDLNSSYDKFQDQQTTVSSQGTNFYLPPPPPPPQQVHAAPVQSAPPLDTKRVNMLQIPTNPRIASNLTFEQPKTEKDSSTSSATLKPAYIAVSLPKPTEKVSSNDAANSILKVDFNNNLIDFISLYSKLIISLPFIYFFIYLFMINGK
jgi:hypothetical protein